MSLLLRITLTEFIRKAVDKRDINRDSIAVPSVGAGYFRLVVHMRKSILDRIGLCIKPALIKGVEKGLYFVKTFTVFVFALYEPMY